MLNTHIPLINYLTKKARRSSNAAKILMDNDLNNDAISRLYYSVLYQTKALLLTVNVDVQKHSTAKVMLALHFTKNKRITKQTFDVFNEILNERIKADYNNFLEINNTHAQEFFRKAQNYLQEIELIIKQEIENSDPDKQNEEQITNI